MKILFVGSQDDCSLEKWYAAHLQEQGIETKLFPAQTIFYDYYRHSLANKLLFKSGLSRIYTHIERELTAEVLRFKPDVVWIFKGMEIYPSFLSWLREQKIRLVNYNADNPFLFSGPGSGNKNVTDSIGLYDLHLAYDTEVRKRIEKEYGIPCGLLPFGYELPDLLYEQCIRQEEVRSVCFLGNPDRQRAEFLRRLAEDLPVHVYGTRWNDHLEHPRITFFGPVYGDEFWKVLYRYRVQLNLMRVHNPRSHNMRSFEIPGVGAIGLFPDTPDHRTYFEDQKEVFLYKDAGDCVRLATEILAMPDEQAQQIRLNARRRSVTSGYSYYERIKAVLPLVLNTHA